MATPQLASPQPDTGLPPGVEVGGLGPRFAAYLIDTIPPGILAVLLAMVVPSASTGLQVILTIVFAVAILGWVLFVLQGIAVRAASPGMRVMKLQLVGFYDGRPIGWGRALVRYLLFAVLGVTGVLLVVMLVLLGMHPRRQGWHDLAAQAVMIKERTLSPDARPGTDQASLADEPDYSSAQPAQTADLSPAADLYAAPSPSAPSAPPAPPAPGPVPLTPPPVQSPVAGAPVPPPSYGPASSDRSAASSARGASPAGPGASWLAVLDDGREIAVDGLVLLGRNPQPRPGEEDAQLIKLADETRTVSKSHLAVGLDAAGLFVVDRGSTNGSTVTTPAGISTRCQPSQVIYVQPGSIVSIGDHWLEIRTR